MNLIPKYENYSVAITRQYFYYIPWNVADQFELI